MKDEILEIYDGERKKTGKIIIRHKEPIQKGEYIIGVHAIIINSKKQILISRRAEHVYPYPLLWECIGGAVSIGETEEQGVIREAEEELGIHFQPQEAILYTIKKTEHVFENFYVFQKDVDINELTFPDGEVIEAKWVSIDEFIQMYEAKQIIPNINFGLKEYNECIEILKKQISKGKKK